MIIGIIEAQKTKNIFLKIKTKEKFGKTPAFIVVEIPVFKDKISNRALKKAEKLLRNQNVDNVLYTCKCKELLTDEYIAKNSMYIPSGYIWHAFWFTLKKFNDDVFFKGFRSVEIIDENLIALTYDILAKLSGYIKYITVITSNDYIYTISDKLFADYGVCIEIRNARKNSYLKSDTILVDVDFGRVLAGDFVLDGIELDINTGSYIIAKEDLAKIFNSFEHNEIKVKTWYSGKNQIKIC